MRRPEWCDNCGEATPVRFQVVREGVAICRWCEHAEGAGGFMALENSGKTCRKCGSVKLPRYGCVPCTPALREAVDEAEMAIMLREEEE